MNRFLRRTVNKATTGALSVVLVVALAAVVILVAAFYSMLLDHTAGGPRWSWLNFARQAGLEE